MFSGLVFARDTHNRPDLSDALILPPDRIFVKSFSDVLWGLGVRNTLGGAGSAFSLEVAAESVTYAVHRD